MYIEVIQIHKFVVPQMNSFFACTVKSNMCFFLMKNFHPNEIYFGGIQAIVTWTTDLNLKDTNA